MMITGGKSVFYVLFFLSCVIEIRAQISPPALGNTQVASWMAIGLRQGLDSANTLQSITYLGMARMSDPMGKYPFQKSAMWIVNQEVYKQFHRYWQYSLALSYRRQDLYEKTEPYTRSNPGIRQEFRFYGRFSNIQQTSKLRVMNIVRCDIRRFLGPNFSAMDEVAQLRFRYRAQIKYDIDRVKNHHLVGSAEALFATSLLGINDNRRWDRFRYRESRLCAYYSYTPQQIPFAFNIGYMNNLMGQGPASDAHYFCLDVIWENPFGPPKRMKERISEFLE